MAIKSTTYVAQALGTYGRVVNAKIIVTSRRTTENVPGKVVPQAIDIPVSSELDVITIIQPSIEYDDYIHPAKDITLSPYEVRQLYEFLSPYFKKEESNNESN